MSEVRTQPDPTAALRAAVAAANARATAAERAHATVQGQLVNERARAVTAEETAVSNAITAAENEANTLSDRWATLQTEGNFTEAAKVMRQMGEATARVDRFKAQKEWLAGQHQVQQQQQPIAPQDPLANYNTQERAWIERHPEFLSDSTTNVRVTAAHFQALADGIVKDSDEYYQRLTGAANPQQAVSSGGSVRSQDGSGQQQQQTQAEPAQSGDAGDDGEAPFSGADDGPAITVSAPQQQHTRPADPVSQTTDAPVMRIAVDPNADANDGGQTQSQPQPRAMAIGRGGAGMQGVAAPSRAQVNRAATRAAGSSNARIEATPQEVDTAIKLAEQLEPDSEMVRLGDVEAQVRWYYALAHSPTHQSTRRRSWAQQSIIG